MNPNQPSVNPVSRWLEQRQIRLLEDACRAAQEIKILEEKYFQGDKIAYSFSQSKTLFDYVKGLRDRQLFKIRVNLAQFQAGGFFLDRKSSNLSNPSLEAVDSPKEAEFIAKLDLIESVIGKYRDEDEFERLISPTGTPSLDSSEQGVESSSSLSQEAKLINPPSPSVSGSRGGLFGLRKEFNPNYEERIVQEMRWRRSQDKTALRWLVILLLIPFLVQVLVKNFVFEPLLGNYSNENPDKVEINQEIKESLFREFNESREQLEIAELLGIIPPLTQEERQERLKENAVELWQEGRNRELSGLKNVLSDGVAILTFAGLIYFNRNKVDSIRSFSNRTFLDLSDPAKVFLFILVTDIFVGFHSAEGWDVLLEGTARHFGLPENRAAINTFIATVPVFLDACVKFWIFSYLTRYSPATSAIYERMNT
ncbi:MAG: hypothetical protein ACRC8A_17495 [Microcoleaceae cyanobacterium]